MKKNQKGFSAIEVLLILVIVGLLSLICWYVWSKQKTSKSPETIIQTQSRNQASSTDLNSQMKYFTFADEKIKFDNGGIWKTATGGYWSNELQRCGRSTEKDTDCLDTQMLIPAEDTFTNPDQYQVNISVFNKNVPIEDLRPNDTDIKRDTAFSLPRYKGEKYQVDYVWVYPEPDEPSKRVTYLLQTEEYTIKVYTIFFNGNHNSYKSDKNYYPYEVKVDSLVKTLQTD